jgi:hypothetical protein
MTGHAFDTVTRTVATDRRRAVLALGAAGLAATLVPSRDAAAKQSAGKKRKKRCKKQKQACLTQVTTFCAQFNEDAPLCQTAVFPCCETCDLATGVICALNAVAAA